VGHEKVLTGRHRYSETLEQSRLISN
jgi:hypothetical protein